MNVKRVLIVAMIGVIAFTMIPASQTFAIDRSATEAEAEQEIEPTAEEYLISDDDPEGELGGISTRAIRSCELSFERKSNIKAIARLEAFSVRSSSSMRSTIYLQKYDADTKAYKTVKGVKSTKNSKSSPIVHSPSFAVSKNGKYRIKAVVTDGSDTKTKYCRLS